MRESLWIVLWGMYLFGTAIVDWKAKMLPRWVLLFSVLLAGASCFYLRVPLPQRLAGSGIGVVFLAISLWGGEAVGLADAVLILLLGVSMGAYTQIVILGAALALLMFAAITLFLLKKVGRKDSIPFLPFLFGGYLTVFVMQAFA